MSEEGLKEIGNLLENILVFETKFKEDLLEKSASLNDAKLNELKNILTEINLWQKKVLDKKIKSDPIFFNKVAGARKKVDEEIINLYKQKLNDEDQKKMEIILNKMKTIY